MDAEQTVGVGDAARIVGTTIRSLRYYEQRGLLDSPGLSAGGHRRYSETDLRRAREIVALRGLGLPLQEIHDLLASAAPGQFAGVLRAQAARIDAELVELDALRHRVVSALARIDAGAVVDETLDLLEELSVKIVLNRIYTRTGDDGTTALGRGARVDKTDDRLEVMGDVDELLAAVGVAIATVGAEQTAVLRRVQNDLFDVGADLAVRTDDGEMPGAQLRITADYVAWVERACDAANAELPALHSFVAPGTSPFTAALHQARAICRRAERHSWLVPDISDEVRRYLNRLSDLLFILAREVEPVNEPRWAPGAHGPE